MYERFNISLRLPIHLFLNKKSQQMVVDKIKECYSKINNLIEAEIRNGSKDYDKEYIRKHVETLTS